MSYIYLVIAFIFNGLANVILKLGSSGGFNFDWRHPWLMAKDNYLFLIGISLFAINVIFYFLALKNIPLSIAYPIMVVMSFLIINTFSIFMLGERFNFWQWIGLVLIVIGITIVYSFSLKK